MEQEDAQLGARSAESPPTHTTVEAGAFAAPPVDDTAAIPEELVEDHGEHDGEAVNDDGEPPAHRSVYVEDAAEGSGSDDFSSTGSDSSSDAASDDSNSEDVTGAFTTALLPQLRDHTRSWRARGMPCTWSTTSTHPPMAPPLICFAQTTRQAVTAAATATAARATGRHGALASSACSRLKAARWMTTTCS